MAYWIFKLSDKSIYPDKDLEEYVYHNTHSVKVAAGDYFVYLDKREKKYAFTTTGKIKKVETREPSKDNLDKNPKVEVFVALLHEVSEFPKPLSIKKDIEGLSNRARLGFKDVNKMGWSISIATLEEVMFNAILELADPNKLITATPAPEGDYTIEDKWVESKKRAYLKAFSNQVKQRSDNQCIVCGSKLKGLMEAAHLSPYAADKKNRANPANGVCLCRYCHRAMDLFCIAIMPDGNLLVNPEMKEDPVANFHFNQISAKQRKGWLLGVSEEFLSGAVERWRAVNKYEGIR